MVLQHKQGRVAPRRFDDKRTGWLRALFAARKGTVAIILAVSMVPLIAATGAAVDMSRAYLARVRLSNALDAAGLAVGSSQGTEAQLREIARRFFIANYPPTALGTATPPTVTIEGGLITLTSTVRVETTMMRVVGIDHLDVAVSSTINREVKGLEVVLVLDNTGSMRGSRIRALRTASSDLVNILFGDQETAEKLTIGLVPFAGTVNLGSAQNGLLTGLDQNAFSPDTWRGCVLARAPPHDALDTSVVAGGAWPPFLWTNDPTNNWPSLRGAPIQTRGPNKHCPRQVVPLINRKSPLLQAITGMQAEGITHINIGAVWGWRLLSPEAPYTQGRRYNDPEYNKALIVMTDGENFINGSSYSAYGRLAERQLGTQSAGQAVNELNRRTALVCENAKQAGIIVYTIAFAVNSITVRNLMQGCATDASKFFRTPTAEDLRQAFRIIASELSNLRIAR